MVNPTNSTVSGASLHYTAFKLYTDNEYNELIDAKIPGGGLSNYALTKSGDNNYQCQWMQVPVVLHTYTEGTAVNYKKIKLRSNSYLTLNLTLKDRIGNEWSISVTLSNVPIVRRVLKGSSDTAAITAFSYSNLTNNSVDIYFRVNSWSTVIIEALDLYGWDTTNRATEISITDSTAEEFNAASYIYPNIVPQMVGGWISDTDVDTLLEPGFYMIAQNNTNLPDTGATSDKYWGSLYVCTNKTDTGSQIFIPMSGNVFVRRMVSRSWYPWEKLAVAT